MEITHIDSYPVNDSEGAIVEVLMRRIGNAQPLTLATRTRERVDMTPAYESGNYQVTEQVFDVHPLAASELTEEAFSELVYGVFLPSSTVRVLTATINGDTYTTRARVTSFGWSNFFAWQGTFQFVDPFWYATTPTVVSDFTEPIEVSGNVPALPTLEVTGGDVVTRQRVTYTDRTGHGVSAYLVSVAPDVDDLDEANYVIYANGLQIPFTFDTGRLYFRIDCPPPPDHTFVDIYQGASINNTVTAGRMDAAGTTLNAALSSGTVEADTDAAISNPLAPSLAWHPSITYRHQQRRNYVYGLDGTDIVLVDSDVDSDAPSLSDDVDSYVIVTGSEAERIRNLSLSVTAGYQPSFNEAAGANGDVRRMRIRMGGFDSFGADGPELAYVQWIFGELTYPPVGYIERLDSTYQGIGLLDSQRGPFMFPEELPKPQDFASYTAEYLGVEVTGGGAGVYYIDFPTSAYGGIDDIPLIQMRTAIAGTADATATVEDASPSGYFLDVDPPAEPLDPFHLFQSDWVDPVTNEPIEDNPDTAGLLPDPLKGQTRAVVKYRTRDSEHWITAWSRTVTGTSPDGRTIAYSNQSIDTPGAVEIAIGLEPVASRAGFVDWGSLEITSVPIIDLVAANMPNGVVSSPITAQRISRTIRNLTTGARIQLTDYLSDAGVEIDTALLTIQGVGGVGPTYGQLANNRGAAMFQLVPGENDIEADDVEISYTERLAI